MTAQASGSYIFIGGVAGERGGVQNNPTIDSTYYTTPTATFTQFANAMSAACGFKPGSKLVNKANGAQYCVPIFLNS
jgi:hypothetical protein